ncbi:endonuclease [Flavobacterium phage 11b]|uniref:endonuclease n=1 Tax=Flavobacterium phage 11b TaxID=294631 RepID=UPI000044411F|nr:endonuclease [Flavobacterium phage 11b]CAH56628.1 endonuclease [Flavobacterium phage 11b]
MECKICKNTTNDLHSHHIVPKSRGGSDNDSNLIKICIKCHGLAHDVSFKNKEKGLVAQAVKKSVKEYDDAITWLNQNNNLFLEKMKDLYQLDEKKHMFVLLLIENGCFTPPNIYKWIIKGEIKIKTTLTI